MHYLWNLYQPASTPNNKKVFSTFACGGGSTMGYKLAGFDVIGANDIDPKMAEIYKANHNPKLFYQCPIKELLTQELPPEMYDLDILDGSPPCSAFSTSGQRDKNWGKLKKFREGQQEQILDELFFDFVSLVDRLRPKVYIAENVEGMLKGEAKKYCIEINRQFQNIGYTCQMFSLNAATMGVPQSRQRVFFIGHRKDLNYPKLTLEFNEKPISLDAVEKGLDMIGLSKQPVQSQKSQSESTASNSHGIEWNYDGKNITTNLFTMAIAIIKKEELSSAIMSLQTKQEVADLLAISTQDLDQEIQTNFNMTFEQKQKQLKTQIKFSKNNAIIMSKKTDKNTTKLLEDNVMTLESDKPQKTTKPITLNHIKVVNNFVDGMTKVASYKKVYGEKLSYNSATKQVAVVMARPEVKEYLAERISELEAMARVTKSKVVKTLAGIMEGKKYKDVLIVDEKTQISAAAQISKMLGYDSPVDVNINGSLEHSGTIEIEFINAKK